MPNLVAGDVTEAARVCRYPRITVFGHELLDPTAWERLAIRATPAERAMIVRRLARYLGLATAEARANFRAWRDAGQPIPPDDARPLMVGDVGIIPLVEAALARVPAWVRYHVIAHVAFEAVGLVSGAWIGAPLTGRPLVVRVGPQADVRTVLHEIGHAIHRAPIVRPLPGAVEWAAAERAIIRSDGERARRHYWDAEALAEACAIAWSAP